MHAGYESAERVRDADGRQYHIGLAPGEVARYIMLVGDPARATRVAGLLDRVDLERRNREYVTYTGVHHGLPVTVMGTGMGAGPTEIAVVELCQVVDNPVMIRCGSSGALQPDMQLGDLVVSQAALRLENTTRFFVDEGYPAVADPQAVLALASAAEANGYRYHVGITATAPGFYGAQGRNVPGFAPRDPEIVARLAAQGVKNLEMETSTLLTLATLRAFLADAVCAVYATPHETISTTHPIRIRRTLLGALLATGLAASTGTASAQAAWPTKTVRVVVGFAPGGTTDVMARSLAQGLTEALGQPVIVDNKPGASGNIAAGEVIKAAPDGYTLLVAPTSVETANPSLFKSNILPSRDLTPVMGIGRTQMYLITRPGLEVKDTKALIALAKANPGKLSYASSGTGTPPQLAGELFKQSTGTFITHVPYRGSGPALQDVMASQADMAFDPGIAFPHIKAGKVKLLAVASDKKSPFFPDVPTYADLGIKDASLDIWFGVWAPNNLPADVTERLSRELTKALTAPAVKERFNSLGAEPIAVATPEFRKLLADEGKTLSALIKSRNIVVD